jgi:predicted DNA-binding transcriptional regulator YafY
MRADRILSILLLLQSQGKMSTRELAGQLEVSERTILRDMEALSMSGVPVYAERGSQGGWLLSEGYRTSLTGMKADEFVSLMVASHPVLLQDLGIRDSYHAALRKLLAGTNETVRESARLIQQKIHIDGAGWHQSNESFPSLRTVQEAVWLERKLRIHYPRDDEMITRTVHPLGLVAKRSVWYLVAMAEDEYRTFRISRIAEAEVLEEGFTPPEHFNLGRYWEQSTVQFKSSLPRYPAALRVQETVLARLEKERYISIVRVEPIDEEWSLAEVEFATLEHGCENVLRYGSGVAVISPSELREKVIEEAEKIVACYKPSFS